MKLDEIVFVPSVQHTGTWFAIEFLRHFFPASRELTFALEGDQMKPGSASIEYEHTYSHPLERPTVLHIHLPIVRHLNMDVNYPESRFQRQWYSNLGTMRSVSVQTSMLFCNLFKTVIPIRDPLAAILSREARHPQLRHFFIVDGFVHLATEFAKHPNVMFLPIDVTDDVNERAHLLRRVLIHCGVDPDPHIAHINAIAGAWEPKNPTPANRFRALYMAGDIDEIRRLLGPKWAEVEYLKNMASIILPFMASLGYTKERLGLW